MPEASWSHLLTELQDLDLGRHLVTHVIKEKDTPFFALLLGILHAGQS